MPISRRCAPADESTTPLPLPTQMISNGEYTPLPQTAAQRQVEARIESYASRSRPRHGMTRREFLASNAGLAAAFMAMNEVFGSAVHDQPGGGRDTRRLPTSAVAVARIPVHRRLPDALRARRLQPADADHGRAFRERALEPRPGGRRRPDPFQVPELREGDLPRQRHQDSVDLGHADRRGRVAVPEQRPDRGGSRHHQSPRGYAPRDGPRHRDAGRTGLAR